MIPTEPGAEHRDTERCDREPWPFSWTVPVETPQSRYQREQAQRPAVTPARYRTQAQLYTGSDVLARWDRELRERSR